MVMYCFIKKNYKSIYKTQPIKNAKGMISLMISIMINSFNCIIRRLTRGIIISYVNNFHMSNKIMYNYNIILSN